MMADRCGLCSNCRELDRVRSRVLACCNSIHAGVYPSSHHADDGVVRLWNHELERLPCLGAQEKIYLTSFCNQGHRLSDGKPINHECHVLNPTALQAERGGDVELALELGMQTGRTHKGLKR